MPMTGYVLQPSKQTAKSIVNGLDEMKRKSCVGRVLGIKNRKRI